MLGVAGVQPSTARLFDQSLAPRPTVEGAPPDQTPGARIRVGVDDHP
jgi:hypothetical protein